MFRYRRYRVFLIFAVFTVFALYKFGTSNSGTTWQAIERVRPGKSESTKDSTRVEWQTNPKVAQDKNKLELDIPAAKSPQPQQTPPPPVELVSRPVDKPATRRPDEGVKPTPAVGGAIHSDVFPDLGGLDHSLPTPTSVDVIYWLKPTEHFPIATESLIKLPTGKPKAIPKIQFNFKKETESEKADRERKLNIIRAVFQRSWDGYTKHAWLQDELLPSTGGFRNPFAGWGATLVDSLDSLWIMGLKDEFEEAVKAVDQIDFTTTPRADIPLFETTIRYMGGLLAAYDLSGKKYKNLLVKAEELAEVLISAFDTPNRMPETYYYWRPDFSTNPHRASNRAVLAEIGSLSMEFTRLAQLTGNDKYYDAIARITDRLEEFQNKTRLPGMWPTFIDISGCKRIDYSTTYKKPLQNPIEQDSSKSTGTPSAKVPSVPLSIPPMKGESELVANRPLSEDPNWTIPPDAEMAEAKPQEDPRKDKTAPMVKPPSHGSPTVPGEKLSPEGHKYVPLNLPSPLVLKPGTADPANKAFKEKPLDAHKASNLKKRQLGADEEAVPARTIPTPTLNNQEDQKADVAPLETRPVCEEIGFTETSDYGLEEYSIGGMADSTYEYLPKQYLLLGGAEPKYRSMYEASANTIKENLIFRPMLPHNDDILVAGKVHIPSRTTTGFESKHSLEPQQEHLTCFAGGMFGVGAKIFDRPDDLDVAIKLTEGCIYSYNMTATGIMPEGFALLPCESRKECEWNQTKYWDTLDPYSRTRLDNYNEAVIAYDEQFKIANAQYEKELKAIEEPPARVPAPLNGGSGAFQAVPTPAPNPAAAAGATAQLPNDREKRQLHGAEDEPLTDSEERKMAIGGHLGGAANPNNSPTKVAPPTKEEEEATPSPSKPTPNYPVIYSPKPPASQEDYVTNRIKEERLPIGVTRIGQRNYILRPEAIESVWYMYRITGNAYYREAGWRMFEAINTATTAKWGNSAIEDVTQKTPILRDEMESFWLAETLKYFYLLFVEEDVLSLDEWVLNTEAHPFRRPT